MKERVTGDIKSFLTEEVLRYQSDTLKPETAKRLSEIRRDKPSRPVIYVNTGTAAVISGSLKSAAVSGRWI